MKNINPYIKENFEEVFKKTTLYSQLVDEYDIVSFEKFFEKSWESMSTPRQQLALSCLSAVPWYYFTFINTDTKIYDLGCGYNLFKKYIHNLIGVGAEDGEQFFGDVKDFVDDDYYHNYRGYYQSLISINALHFRPLENLRDICLKFSNMLSPGGTGFLALNYSRMKEASNLPTWDNMAVDEIEEWILSQFDNFPCKILVLDVDLSCIDAWLNGNIKVVFENS